MIAIAVAHALLVQPPPLPAFRDDGARVRFRTIVGWAGPRGELRQSRPLAGWGVGASLLDGLIRMDVAWPLRDARGGRFYVYFDGLF